MKKIFLLAVFAPTKTSCFCKYENQMLSYGLTAYTATFVLGILDISTDYFEKSDPLFVFLQALGVFFTVIYLRNCFSSQYIDYKREKQILEEHIQRLEQEKSQLQEAEIPIEEIIINIEETQSIRNI